MKQSNTQEKRNDDNQIQIDKIAKELCSQYKICTCTDRNGRCSVPQQHAKIIVDLGYRKEEAVVSELLARIKERAPWFCYSKSDFDHFVAELDEVADEYLNRSERQKANSDVKKI